MHNPRLIHPLHTPLMVPAVPKRGRTLTPVAPPSPAPSTVSAADLATGQVKGEMLMRIWLTFRLRAHDRRVLALLDRGLVEKLYANDLLANEWYPIERYLALYGALHQVAGHDEVVQTATDSVIRGFKRGSWKAFVPVLSELSPDAFCALLARRFPLVWKHSFQPGEVVLQLIEGGAELTVDVPWSGEPAFQGGVQGGLLAIPAYAGLKGACTVGRVGEGASKTAVRFRVRWRKDA